MVEARAADYIAAAVAYAIDIQRIPPTSEGTSFFVELLKGEFRADVPEPAVRQALKILNDEAVLISDCDRFKPTIKIPEDAHDRVVKWRFSEHPTQAAQIHDRFSNGSWDWMATVLASPEFKQELQLEVGSSAVLSDQFKTWEILEAKVARDRVSRIPTTSDLAVAAPTSPGNVIASASIDWGKWGALASMAAIPVALVIWWFS